MDYTVNYSTMHSNLRLNSPSVLCIVLCLLSQLPKCFPLESININNNIGASVVNKSAKTTTPQHNVRLDDVTLFKYFKDHYDRRLRGRLRVTINDVTTSSINVKWNLPELMFHDSVLESNVFCETSTGYLLSKKHVSSSVAYRLDHLHANTSYIVCVYMLEKSKSSNTTVLHFSCHQSKTEPNVHTPSLRTDSIVAVVITLGYITVMIIIGYATWKWKTKKQAEDEAKEKLAIEDDDDYDGDVDNGVVNGGLSGGYVRGGACDNGTTKDKSSLRGSGRLYSNSEQHLGDGKGKSKSNDNVGGTVTFSENEVVLEKNNWKRNSSAEDVNGGCLDFKRNSRGSVKLDDFTDSVNKQEKTRPKSQSLEDSPVKVTEITF